MCAKTSLQVLAIVGLSGVCGIAGCIPVAVAGASQGIEYTFTQVAYRSFTRSRPQVHMACLQAMSNMRIEKVSDDATDGSIKIKGKTKDLKISITLTTITPRVTKVSVNAEKYFFVKDKTVAVEVLMQTAQILGVR